jgi:hypothetical protein
MVAPANRRADRLDGERQVDLDIRALAGVRELR